MSIRDGAGVSLDRQLDMLRKIFSSGKRGISLGEIQLYVRARHGLSKQWVVQYVKEWRLFGIITIKGNKFTISEDAWKQIQDLREQPDYLEDI